MPDFQKNQIDAEALHTFVTVAQLRSISAAAEMVHNGGLMALGVARFHNINDDFVTEPPGVATVQTLLH